MKKKSRGNGGGVTPVPIPNTAVKPSSADGTWAETSWESRSLRDFCSSVAQWWSNRLLTGRLLVRVLFEGHYNTDTFCIGIMIFWKPNTILVLMVLLLSTTYHFRFC